MKIIARLISAICIFNLSNIAFANENKQALLDAIELCFDIPLEQNLAIEKLSAKGWSKASNDKNENDTIYKVLYSNMFTSNHRSDDLNYTYTNSHFMAASVLGNSALLPNQPAFTYGKITLGVLGIREGSPYCVFTGPKWVASEIEKRFNIELRESLPYLKSFSGDIDGNRVTVQEIDKEKLYLQKHNIPSEKVKDYYRFDKDGLNEANMLIISHEVIDKKN